MYFPRPFFPAKSRSESTLYKLIGCGFVGCLSVSTVDLAVASEEKFYRVVPPVERLYNYVGP